MLLAQYITVHVTWMDAIVGYGIVHILFGLFTHYKSTIQIKQAVKSDEAKIEQLSQQYMVDYKSLFPTLEDARTEVKKDILRVGRLKEQIQCKHKIFNAVIATLFLGRVLFGLPFYIGKWAWRLIVLILCLRNDKSITEWHMTPRDISDYSCVWF